MADDRFVIQKVEKTKCAECKLKKYEVCEREESEFMLCPVTNKTVAETIELHRGKTRAEYEAMIAETLWNKHYKVYLKTYKEALGVHDSLIQCTMDTVHGLAKAVVDRLLGEGE